LPAKVGAKVRRNSTGFPSRAGPRTIGSINRSWTWPVSRSWQPGHGCSARWPARFHPRPAGRCRGKEHRCSAPEPSRTQVSTSLEAPDGTDFGTGARSR